MLNVVVLYIMTNVEFAVELVFLLETAIVLVTKWTVITSVVVMLL